MAEITIFLALLAGLASFLSPCVVPLIPGFLSYLAGTSSVEIKEDSKRAKVTIFLNTIFFVVGFSLIFALLGVLLNSVLADTSFVIRNWLAKIGGVIIIIFGLFLLGLIRIPFLESEHKLKVKKFKYSYPTSFVFGATFAVGWTPCVGVILGTVLTLAATQPGSAFNLLLAYSVGLGIPFLITGLFVSQAADFIKRSQRYL